MERAVRGGATILVAILIWLLPSPAGVAPKAWHLLAIFAATIAGLILQPLPMGAVVLVGTMTTALTNTLSPADALNGFANTTVWLIFAAFLFARGFIKTGLGRRIAYWFIRAFGRRTLGLAYALALSDLVIAPATPSNTARAGGVLYPIVRGLTSTFNSEPGPTAGRIGRFLMLSTYQCDVITSAMFMTSMAANPLIVELTKKTVNIQLSWGGWALAALLPGLLSLLVMPLVVYWLVRPEITETPEATTMARDELTKMGRIRREEWVVMGVFLIALALWGTATLTGLDATVVALLGVGIMLATGVLGWDDVLGERGGWDALIWFGGLVGMATMLGRLGLIKWFSEFVAGYVKGWAWLPALGILLLVYLYSHYGFASLTAHVSAMFVPFLVVSVAAGAPPLLAALSLAFFSNLNASLTHYGTGPAPIYYGADYADLKTFWGIGFVASLVNIIIWLGIGPFYWKALGLF
ncbi:MAG: DASS family sodium-coupled anion symporter [Candidatus Methylomirabilales bacterium]